jgi:hypothetical protein
MEKLNQLAIEMFIKSLIDLQFLKLFEMHHLFLKLQFEHLFFVMHVEGL